jgi:hypothetical protein
MTKATATEIKAAARKASAWGTAAACGAGDGILILPPSIRKKRPGLVDDSLGLYFPMEREPGAVSTEGDIPAYLRYDGLDLFVALAMGATGGTPARQGLTAAYAQDFLLARQLDGLFATFALNNYVNVEECPSVKVTGFTIKGEVGRPLQITFHCLANDKTTDSGVNTLATFQDVTYFETANRVLMSQGVFRMNARSGAALGAGDEIYPSSFELAFKRTMEGTCAAGSPDMIDEPINSGMPEVSLKLQFPRYSTNAYFVDWDSDEAKKLDMTFTGAELESPFARLFKVEFPHLRFSSVDLPMERGILKHPVEFACLACESAPAGMDGITEPFRVGVVNRQSSDVLA